MPHDDVLGFMLLHASFYAIMRRNVPSLEARTQRHDFLGHTTAVARTHTANLALHSRGMQTCLHVTRHASRMFASTRAYLSACVICDWPTRSGW